MQTVHEPAALRELLQAQRSDRRVVLVPTMGALHAGHLSLMAIARQHAGENGTVVVSIFVNPIQFDRKDDLAAYPRPVEADLSACRAAGVDVVFAPDAHAMYWPDRSITVTEAHLSRHLCGAARPGHFDGVCTVCLKLFLLTGCHAAVFGEKDFQQLAVIRRMTRDLDVPVEIIAAPTLREPDGLAMSSRNVRLTPDQRADAPRIRHALTGALQDQAHAGQAAAETIIARARRHIEASPHARIDYLELVDADTLEPIRGAIPKAGAILAAAVFYGEVRLIDHIHLAASPPAGLCRAALYPLQ